MPDIYREYSVSSFKRDRLKTLLAELQHRLPTHKIIAERRKHVDKDETSDLELIMEHAFSDWTYFSLKFRLESDSSKIKIRLFENGDLLYVECESVPKGLNIINECHDIIALSLGLLPPSRDELESTISDYDMNKRIVRILKKVEGWDGPPLLIDQYGGMQCFVSFHFNEHSMALAFELRDFLEILGIRFVSGTGYEPRSISEKVLERLNDNVDLFVVIFTRENGTEWLQQEIGIAKAKKLPVMVLIEGEISIATGLLSDNEYFRFPENTISKTFFPFLQAVRYLQGKKS